MLASIKKIPVHCLSRPCVCRRQVVNEATRFFLSLRVASLAPVAPKTFWWSVKFKANRILETDVAPRNLGTIHPTVQLGECLKNFAV